MKIPKSIRDLYQELLPKYQELDRQVSTLLMGRRERRWHYEGRVKTDESFALKLETGRETRPKEPEDFFACTLVVENHSRLATAEKLVSDLFTLQVRRPKNPAITHLQPFSFDFDDLRLYVKWKDGTGSKPTGLAGTLFEVQIKTFLQHAWGIATHDFIYKSDGVDWASSRIAYQVKAMLENAELSIGEAKKLTDSAMLARIDGRFSDLKGIIEEIKKRWHPDLLPTDLRRLAQTVDELTFACDVPLDGLWKDVDEATSAGEGAKTLNLSPFGAIVAALIRKRGADLFRPLADPSNRARVFIAREISLPALSRDIMSRIIQA